MTEESYLVSKQRVADHGEVYTPKHIVQAMLDLVKQESERIEARFLEPACGTGNFLAEVLERKLRTVEARYFTNRKARLEYERNAVLAVSSIYGVDILADNVEQCRQRLFGIFELNYLRLFANKTSDRCRQSVAYILDHNIVHGDALTLQTVGDPPKPIVFPEWSPVNGNRLKRRDFTFHSLMEQASHREMPLFSDLGEEAIIPTPLREYPPVHFLKIGESTNGREWTRIDS